MASTGSEHRSFYAPSSWRVYVTVVYRDVTFFYPDRETMRRLIEQDAAGRQNGRIVGVHVTLPRK